MLLIVPEGIEIRTIKECKDVINSLLIVPEGIEIWFLLYSANWCFLLIVPEGIEICFL